MKRNLRSLGGVEVSDCAVVSEEISTSEKLGREVNVAVVLEESIVVELQGIIQK